MSDRRDPVVIGVGESDRIGRAPGTSSLGFHAEAARAALSDAGISKEHVDGVLTNESYLDYHVRHAMAFAEYFGVPSAAQMITSLPLGSGASSGLFVHHAASAVQSGRCETVLAVSGDNFLSGLQRTGAVQALADNRDKEFEAVFGPILPACFALVAQRHMYERGSTSEELAAVAVTMRHHARLNRRAHMQGELAIDDVLGARMIADPFTLTMCSLVSDGGAAVVVTTRERAEDLDRPYVEILGMATAYGTGGDPFVENSLSNAVDLLDIGTGRSAPEAMGRAGITHADVDLLMTYDCFAIMPILFLEAAGFCKPGEGGAFFAEGRARVGADLAINTHGGMMSYCHPGNPGGLFMFTEAVRQLRHEAGQQQVADCEVVMVTGYGGQMAFWPVTVLGRGVVTDGRRLPVPTEDSHPFWEGCRAGVLRFQWCETCGQLNWFPRRMCRACSSDDLRWREVAGTGVVYSWSVVRRPPSDDFPVAYVLALIDVDGGPRMLSHVIGPVDAVSVGMRVAVTFQSMSTDIALPVFRAV